MLDLNGTNNITRKVVSRDFSAIMCELIKQTNPPHKNSPRISNSKYHKITELSCNRTEEINKGHQNLVRLSLYMPLVVPYLSLIVNEELLKIWTAGRQDNLDYKKNHK
jgi:hypothetical protein